MRHRPLLGPYKDFLLSLEANFDKANTVVVLWFTQANFGGIFEDMSLVSGAGAGRGGSSLMSMNLLVSPQVG